MDEAPRRGRGRPRKTEADAEILDVALALVRAGGYRELTLDEVARRAGVAKTTIYRRWPSKAALAAELVRRESELPDDVPAILASFTRLLTGDLAGVVLSLVAEGEAAVLRPYRDALIGLTGAEEADRLLGAIWSRVVVGGESADRSVCAT